MSRAATIGFLCLLTLPASPQQGTPPDAARAAVERVLGEWQRAGSGDADELTDRLVDLGSKTTTHLCWLLDHRPPDLPVEPIARSLGRLNSTQAIPTLARLASSPAATERLAAVDALDLFAGDQVLDDVVKFADDLDTDVAERAERAVLRRERTPWRVILAIERRIPAARDKSRLARMLAAVPDEGAHEALLGLLADREQPTKLAALQGLWILARPADGDAVVDALGPGNSVGVRKQACLFVGKIQFRPASRDLIDVLYCGEVGLAANAHWALKRISGQDLKLDPELWEQWWERVGKQRSGSRADGDDSGPCADRSGTPP